VNGSDSISSVVPKDEVIDAGAFPATEVTTEKLAATTTEKGSSGFSATTTPMPLAGESNVTGCGRLHGVLGGGGGGLSGSCKGCSNSRFESKCEVSTVAIFPSVIASLFSFSNSLWVKLDDECQGKARGEEVSSRPNVVPSEYVNKTVFLV